MNRKLAAAFAALLIVGGLAGCGTTASNTSARNSSATTSESSKDAKDDSLSTAQSLASGLSGSCSGDNDNLKSVTLKTVGQYLSVEIPNPLMQASESVLYSITFVDPSTGYTTQAGFKNVFSTGEYSRFVFDMNTAAQKNYPGEYSSDFTAEKFSTSLPDPAIKGGAGTEWSATLSVNGQDIATCPADGSKATLE